MPNDRYELVALIPLTSDFTVESAVEYFKSLHFRKAQLQSDLVQSEGNTFMQGFRVSYGNWSVVAWLDTSSGVLEDSHELASRTPLPAKLDDIANCASRLSIISDDDPELNFSDQITHFTDMLRERFRVFIWDPVNGEWWS